MNSKQSLSTILNPLRLLVCALLVSATGNSAAALEQTGTSSAKTVLTFGIVPQQSASRLAQIWTPLMAQLSVDAGIQIEFRTTKDIPTFEACLANGAYDLAYMNPQHYVIFSEISGYQALARQRGKRLRGLMVARKDSDITNITDLQGAQIAFPSPGAFGASVLPRAELQANGIAFSPNYVKSHDSVYRAVAAGLFPAGGGVTRTFNSIDASLRNQLQVIFRTGDHTPHAIAALGSVPVEVQAAITAALLKVNDSHPNLVEAVGMKGFVAAQNEDWSDVRALGLGAAETGITTVVSDRCPSG